MRRSVAVAALVFVFVSCTTGRKLPHPSERLLPRRAPLIERPLEPNAQVHDDHEGDIHEAMRRHFIRPRAWPDAEIDPKRRLQAYQELLALRALRGLRHIPAEWLALGDGPLPRADRGGICAWTSAGPTNINGRVTHIAIDPTNRDRIFVTSVGGIWRSADRGRRWQRVSDEILAGLFASVAINPDNPEEVLVGGGDPNYHTTSNGSGIGIWRSTEGGDPGTWSKVSPPELDNQVIYRLAVDPEGANDVYAAASNGVYIGTRTGPGMTWSRIGGFDGVANDIAVDFSATPRVVYAGVRADGTTYKRGIWKWDGTKWNRSDSGVPTTATTTINLALARSEPRTLYVKVAREDGTMQGIYKTTDAGANWAVLPNASVVNDAYWYSDYNSVIEVDPTDAGIVYAGGLSLWRTADGGTTWKNVSGGADPDWPLSIHADQHAVAFDPVEPKIVYSGNDGGIDRSTDTTMATWRWKDISHGMIITQFYRVAVQMESATLIAGGSQDNGTEISFGNRTWYNSAGCDGADVAVESADSDTLYANCNGSLFLFANPVPGTPGAGETIKWVSPSDLQPSPPLVTNPTAPSGGALASAGGEKCDPVQILKTTDGVNWTSIATLPPGGQVSFISIAPGTSFLRYYVGVNYSEPPTGCTAAEFDPVVWRTTDGGTSWSTTSSGVPKAWLAKALIDPANPDRAFLVSGHGGVALTTDGGATWIPVTGTLPTGTYLADGAIDPSDPNIFYLATSIGMFKGVITAAAGAASAVWTPFDEGLPDGLYITDVEVNPANNTLTIGSFGHGAFHRDITPGKICPSRILLVRDNVFDRGDTPSPFNVPDPEHPIPDPARPKFYKPDDTLAGRLYWWTSTDIRIDVPAANPPQNQLEEVDHVEFETCPLEVPKCRVGELLDSPPRSGSAARVYVQATNGGIKAITNVRVITLYTDATTALPLLPADFWSTTFPSSGGCGALDTSTGWKFIDPSSPCKTIPLINPTVPEVVRFDWNVPADAADHMTFLTIVEAADDPIDPAVRLTNERRPWVLVPQNRHVGLRNLHIVDPPASPSSGAWEWAEAVLVPNPGPEPFVDLLFAENGVDGAVRVMLPGAAGVETEGMQRAESAATEKELAVARARGLDPSAIFAISGGTARLRLPVPAGQTWSIALSTQTDKPARIAVGAFQAGTILGGSTYVLRGRPKTQ